MAWDGVRWREMAWDGVVEVRNVRRERFTLEKKSRFGHLKTKMSTIIRIIYEWANNTKIMRIKRETGAKHVAINSIFKIMREPLEKCKRGKIGGSVDCLVEIDGTAVSKRKFNRGRRVSTLWCVGGIYRTHKTFFFELTTVRSRAVLHKTSKIM